MNPVKWIFLIIFFIILAVIIAVACGVPALDWLAKVFDFIADIFDGVGKLCRKLQDMINWIR